MRNIVTRCLCVFSVAFLALLDSSAYASTPRAMEWQGVPLSVTLTPKQEIILNFGSDVRVATPAYLTSTLSVTSLAGRVYLTANAPFDVSRLQVMRLSDGMRLLLNVSAKTGEIAPPKVDIVLPTPASETSVSLPNGGTHSETEQHLARLKMAPEALLVRYAMQSLYSPSYAVEPLPGVVRSPMGLPKSLASSTFVKWHVKATPIAAWQLGNNVVTAVSLTNLSSHREALDPRLVTLGGTCLQSACYVAFSHPELGEADSDTKQATAFIVTPGPLSAFLLAEAS